MKEKIIIFASGTKDGGGSGFRKLCERVRSGELEAEIAAVVSNHENGGVRKIAEEFGTPFIHFTGPFTAEKYQQIVKESGAGFVFLSGWLKLVQGLDPTKTVNIHPGPLPRFGGKGMYGHYVHEKVMEAYKNNRVSHSAVTMHFVTDEYDRGPVIFKLPIEILPSDTPETLGARVNKAEHEWQWQITNKVIKGEISWDGKDPDTLVGAILLQEAEIK